MTAEETLERIRKALGGGEGPLRQAINTITPAASSHRGLVALRNELHAAFEAYDAAHPQQEPEETAPHPGADGEVTPKPKRGKKPKAEAPVT